MKVAYNIMHMHADTNAYGRHSVIMLMIDRSSCEFYKFDLMKWSQLQELEPTHTSR